MELGGVEWGWVGLVRGDSNGKDLRVFGVWWGG